MANCSQNQKSSFCSSFLRTPQSRAARRGVGQFQMALVHASTLHYVNLPSDSSRRTCHILKEEFSLTALPLPNGIRVLCGPCQDVRLPSARSSCLAPTIEPKPPIFQRSVNFMPQRRMRAPSTGEGHVASGSTENRTRVSCVMSCAVLSA